MLCLHSPEPAYAGYRPKGRGRPKRDWFQVLRATRRKAALEGCLLPAGAFYPRVLFTRGCFLPAGAFYPRVLFTRGCFLPAGAFYPRVLFTRRDRETRHVLSQSLP